MIKLVEQNAEEKFLIALEGGATSSLNRGVLVCNFSQIGLTVNASAILPFLKNILREQDAEIYFCGNGDILICWRGRMREVMEAIIKAFLLQYTQELAKANGNEIFQYYDNKAQDEELRLLVRQKLQDTLKNYPTHSPNLSKNNAQTKWQPIFLENQLLSLQSHIARRHKRDAPELLIVEDQEFSRKLLLGLLGKHFVCHSAATAKQAVNLYAEHAPDITFLDIELPEADGHQLAALFKKTDPEGYIVMVTANHYNTDVETAKANKVQGYIAKPYNKQKIIDAVEKYMKHKNKT